MLNYEFKKIKDTYILRLNKGAEIIQSIKDFCNENNIKTGTVQGIWAVNSATFGFFNPENKKYQERTFSDPREITSLLGNITTKNGEIYLHLHMNTSGADYNTIGGHLISATISLTGEIFITQIDTAIERFHDENTGLNLFKF